MMEFEWDPAKRLQNIAKHGIDFVAVPLLFEGHHILEQSPRRDEPRWKVTGLLHGRMVTTVFTLRLGRIRVISAEKHDTMNEHATTRFTADECARLQDSSDWARVDALSDADLEASIQQDPDADVEPADLLEGSTVQDLLAQEQRAVFVRLRLKHEVIAYFQGGGEDFERRMGAVLEAYVASQIQNRASAGREKSVED